MKMNRVLIRTDQNEGWLLSSLIVFGIAAGGIKNGALPLISIIGIFSGFFLLGLRRYYMIDMQSKSVERCWRFLRVFPIFSLKRRPVSDFSAIHIRIEYKDDGDGDTFKLHLVKLKGNNSLVVAKYTNYLTSRRLAEKLSQSMQLPLSDKISGAVSIRQPEEISLTLRERLQRNGSAPHLPHPPSNDIVRVSANEGITDLALAPQPASQLIIAVLSIVGGAFSAICFIVGGAGGWISGGLVLFFSLFFIARCISTRFPLNVKISAKAIEIRQTILFHKRMDIASLDEIALGPQGLFFLGKNKYVVLPYAFSRKDEKEAGAYIRDLICHIIANKRGQF